MTTVFYAATRGKRHSIRVTLEEDGTYRATFLLHANSDGTATGYNKEQMIKRIADHIHYAKKIDGITYLILDNDLGVPLDKDYGM